MCHVQVTCRNSAGFRYKRLLHRQLHVGYIFIRCWATATVLILHFFTGTKDTHAISAPVGWWNLLNIRKNLKMCTWTTPYQRQAGYRCYYYLTVAISRHSFAMAFCPDIGGWSYSTGLASSTSVFWRRFANFCFRFLFKVSCAAMIQTTLPGETSSNSTLSQTTWSLSQGLADDKRYRSSGAFNGNAQLSVFFRCGFLLGRCCRGSRRELQEPEQQQQRQGPAAAVAVTICLATRISLCRMVILVPSSSDRYFTDGVLLMSLSNSWIYDVHGNVFKWLGIWIIKIRWRKMGSSLVIQ